MSLARLRRPDRQRLLLALAMPLLLARLLVPPGFMPVVTDGALRLVLCPMQGALPMVPQHQDPHADHAQHAHHAHAAPVAAPVALAVAATTPVTNVVHDGAHATGGHTEAPCAFACSANMAPPPAVHGAATFARTSDRAPATRVEAAPQGTLRSSAQPRAPPRFS